MTKFVVLVLATCGTLAVQAQDGVWCDMPRPDNQYAEGSHLVWFGDSVYYMSSRPVNVIEVSKYDPKANQWTVMDYTHGVLQEGAASAWAGGSYIYTMAGGDQRFLRLRKNNRNPDSMANVPAAVGAGGALCWLGGDSILAFTGGTAGVSRLYRISTNTWSGSATLPGLTGQGACMAWVGASDSVFALRGGGTRGFWHYRGGNWVERASIPVEAGAGAALVWNGETGSESKLFMVPGGGSNQVWVWDVSTGVWDSLPRVAAIGGGHEGALATFDQRTDRHHLYVFQGTAGVQFWRYGSKVTAALPFAESFEGSFFPPQGYKVSRPLVTRLTSGTNPTAVPWTGTWMGAFLLYGNDPGVTTRLRTPQLDIDSTPMAAKMSFRMYQSPNGGAGSGDTLFVWFSTDGVNFATRAAFPRYNSSAGWYPKSTVLASNLTGTFYAALHAKSGTSGDNFNIYVDSARIWGTSYQDVGTTAIVSPTDTVTEGTLISPQATVRNHGTSSASFKVTFKIGSVYTDSQQVNGLAPNDSATLTFNSWTADRGSYVAKCSTAMVGDEDLANDAITRTVFVAAYDVGATNVLAPTGTLDSGSAVIPRARVKNYGNIRASFYVVLRIGGFYADTVGVWNLDPGDSARADFREWSVLQRGAHAVKCSTMIGGDRDRSNDAASGSVTVQVRDVAATVIVSPGSTVDSGTTVTPQAVVHNHGNTRESFAARFTIGASYANNQNVTDLSPGDSAVVNFTNWQATQVGTYVVRCSTMLVGDMVNSNNRVEDTTVVRARPDVGAVRVVTPSGSAPFDSGTTISPQLLVRNYGSVATSVPAVFRIGTFYTDTSTLANLNPGDSSVITFRSWNIRERGMHAIRCSTMTAGDRNPVNDTCRGSVTVQVKDVAATAILAPGDSVDSGATVTPQAAVHNYGTTQESFAVRFIIGGFYTNNQNVNNLSPGGSVVVNFANWQATQPGTHAVRCSTMLVGDMVSSNNRVEDTTVVRHRQPVLDVGAVRVVAPSGSAPYDSGTTISPQLLVRNVGEVATSVTSVFRIGTFYTDTSTLANLNPGDSNVITFRSWDIRERGVHAMRCSTMAAGDVNPTNDTCSGSVTVRVRDVAATAILEPIGVIDWGTVVAPKTVVRNRGTGTETFAVRFLIGSFYSDDTTATVASLAQDTVVFASWRAESIGTHIVRCSTRLAGDMVPSNDAVQDSVVVVAVGVEESGSLPANFTLLGASPNPFRARMHIGYALPRGCDVRLAIFDATGMLVRVLVEGSGAAGLRSTAWDGRDRLGRLVPSGLYFYRLEAGEFSAVGRALRTD